MSRHLLSALVILIALAPTVAQEAKTKDPQSAFEPRSGPGAGQKHLAKFVGVWEVEKVFYPRSGGAAVQTQGSCRQTMIHGGRFLQSDFVFQGSTGPSTGMGIVGFDSATGRFTSVWTDARATRMSFRQSQEPWTGGDIILYGQTLSEKAGARSRTVTHLEDNGQRLLHRQYTLDADGSARLVMELLMTRKKE